MATHARRLHGLALCAGVGGLELALDLAFPGYRTVGYVEREAFAATALVARMEEARLDPAPIWDDLASFDGRPWRGKVDLISAGFPCQPFSKAGQKRGVEDERWLWPDIERICGEVCPRWIVLENVSGLVRHGLGPVLGGLARLGFDAEWALRSAEAVGAPHQRERCFLLARRVSDTERDPIRKQPERRASSAQEAEPGNAELGHMGAADLGDTKRAGLEGSPAEPEKRGRGDPGAAARSTGSDGRALAAERGGMALGGGALFPPRSDDLAMWAEVLAEAPSLEPAFCKLAHGLAADLDFARADKIQAAGNGVVPLQAASAILALADRAGWLEELMGGSG